MTEIERERHLAPTLLSGAAWSPPARPGAQHDLTTSLELPTMRVRPARDELPRRACVSTEFERDQLRAARHPRQAAGRVLRERVATQREYRHRIRERAPPDGARPAVDESPRESQAFLRVHGVERILSDGWPTDCSRLGALYQGSRLWLPGRN